MPLNEAIDPFKRELSFNKWTTNNRQAAESHTRNKYRPLQPITLADHLTQLRGDLESGYTKSTWATRVIILSLLAGGGLSYIGADDIFKISTVAIAVLSEFDALVGEMLIQNARFRIRVAENVLKDKLAD